MADKGNGKGHARPEQVAIYVADLARQLKQMAERHDLPELAYLLDLVRGPKPSSNQGQSRVRTPDPAY